MTDRNKEFLQRLLTTFRSEAQEHLQEIISNVVLLEQATDDSVQKDLVGRILRTLHTLKGAARAVNQSELENLCHTLESVFTKIESKNFVAASNHYDLMHQAGNVAQALVREPSGRVRNQARALIARLEQLTDEVGSIHPDLALHKSAEHELNPLAPTSLGTEQVKDGANAVMDVPQADVIRVQSRHLDAIRHHSESLLSVELSLQHHIDGLLELAEEMSQFQLSQLQAAQQGGEQAGIRPYAKGAARKTHRGRPVAYRSNASDPGKRLLELRCRHLASSLGRTRRNFQVIRSKLMEANLEAALVPVSSGLETLPALARNLARSQGKEVALRIEGESIQIDRPVLGIVREALIHLVTNAIDHGIEPADARHTKGKPPAGTVRIQVAQHNANQVSVTVSDDGVGIDVDAVLKAAAQRRNLREDQLAELNAQQKLELALLAGVSTSSTLTQVSGRGVGLAIVAEKIASVGGELSIENSVGSGCVFRLMLPVRLSTMRALVVRVDGVLYVLPLSGIESVRSLKEGDIQTVENRETLVADNHVISVVRLGELLRHQISREETAAEQTIAVIVRCAGRVFALPVDEILSEQEVLPKNLGKQLRRVRYITGATHLTDGSLVPILGLEDISRFGLATVGNPARENKASVDVSATKRVLVAEDSITSRLLLKHILESAGYQVDTAVDGLDALSKLRNQDFDVLVSDIEMPRMDGLALTQSIRANPETTDLPVVLVTSLQSPEEKERGLRAGADAYVVKGSFDQDNLLATIRRLI